MVSENAESLGGNVFGGNTEGAAVDLSEIQNQLWNIRADIGDTKFD